jgi:hypothetical protein
MAADTAPVWCLPWRWCLDGMLLAARQDLQARRCMQAAASYSKTAQRHRFSISKMDQMHYLFENVYFFWKETWALLIT